MVLLACRIEDPVPQRPPEDDPNVPRLAFLRLEPYLTRWTFNLVTGAVREERLDDVPTEFPRMNEDRLGRPTRYTYNPRLARESTLLFDAIVKYDTDAGGSTTFEHGRDRFASESVFAPRPGGRDEDDGWLVLRRRRARGLRLPQPPGSAREVRRGAARAADGLVRLR